MEILIMGGLLIVGGYFFIKRIIRVSKEVKERAIMLEEKKKDPVFKEGYDMGYEDGYKDGHRAGSPVGRGSSDFGLGYVYGSSNR